MVRSMKQYTVRRSKVENALRWLKRHHRAYADIAIEPKLLAKLPEGAVPECFVDNALQALPTRRCGSLGQLLPWLHQAV